MTNINLLAELIRKDGKAAGWTPVTIHDWSTSDYKIPCFLALISSEIDEAFAEVCNMDCANNELAGLEFADIHIRTLDLAGGITADFAHYVRAAEDIGFYIWPNEGENFLALHARTTKALEAFRKDRLPQFLSALGELYFVTSRIAEEEYDIDLALAVDEKMAFNRIRTYGDKRV